MELYRIGEKVISRDKLVDSVDAILSARQSGATQEEVAREAGVQRSFVSFLETLGEVRRGPRVALVGFPIENCDAVRDLATGHAVDFVLVVSQAERESIETGSPSQIFNQLLETLAAMRDFDTLVLIASDWRIKTIEKILDIDVIGIPLGHTPIREDKHVDIAALDRMLTAVMAAPVGKAVHSGRVGGSLRDVAQDIAGRWTQSKK